MHAANTNITCAIYALPMRTSTKRCMQEISIEYQDF
jgi:hypothetical protein